MNVLTLHLTHLAWSWKLFPNIYSPLRKTKYHGASLQEAKLEFQPRKLSFSWSLFSLLDTESWHNSVNLISSCQHNVFLPPIWKNYKVRKSSQEAEISFFQLTFSSPLIRLWPSRFSAYFHSFFSRVQCLALKWCQIFDKWINKWEWNNNLHPFLLM